MKTKHPLQKHASGAELAPHIGAIDDADLHALHQAEAAEEEPRVDVLREINRERNRRMFGA